MSKPLTNMRQHLLISYVFLTLSLMAYSNVASAEAMDRDKPIDLEADS